MLEKILIIGGSTAVGKSEFALTLSKKLKMEIISADSIQVYKGLKVGTSKPSEDEKKICPHHLIDIVPTNSTFNAYNFMFLSKQLITQILSRGNLPVIVGGTGLYIESLLYDYNFKKKERSNQAVYDYTLLILNQNREKLYKKINKRVDKMIQNGLVEEVKMLKESGLIENNQCSTAIGYKEILAYLNDEYSLECAIEKVKQNTRNYAKRQITWFKHMDGIWVDVDNQLEIENAINLICANYKNYLK